MTANNQNEICTKKYTSYVRTQSCFYHHELWKKKQCWERQKRNNKEHTWLRRMVMSDEGHAIKRYKQKNAESTAVFCQAEGFKLRLPHSLRTHSLAITTSTCGSHGRGDWVRGGQAVFLVNIHCAALFSLDAVFKAQIWCGLLTAWHVMMGFVVYSFIILGIFPLGILPGVHLGPNYIFFILK